MIEFKQAKAEDGKYYDLSVSMTEVSAPATPVEPGDTQEPEQPTTPAGIPLSYNDSRFSGNTTSPSTKVANGGTLTNKSITDTGHTASIVTGNGATIKNCRVNSREGVRIGGGGSFLIEGCYLEATGSGDDHADTIQTYSPGSRGTLRIKDTAIVAHNQAATAGLFVADNWTGTIELENVVFKGGPFGCRIHPDVGGNNTLRFKNVFFVGPFGYRPLYLSDAGGNRNVIDVWENVRNATIVDGKLIPGTAIPKP